MPEKNAHKTDVWSWIMLGVSFIIMLDYARLILTTETASYRIFVLLTWIIIFLIYLVRIIRLHRQNQANL